MYPIFKPVDWNHFAPTELRDNLNRRSINISLERQGKLGVSNWVQVPVEQGLTNHSYRVLQP